MPEAVPARRVLRFGAFEVDLQSGELRKHGLKIKIQEQPFQILTMLLEHPGELVTREQIQHKLWQADTFVDFEHSLNSAIKKLREALGDDADNPRFIETLHRRGYKLITPVHEPAISVKGVGLRRLLKRPRARRYYIAAGTVLTVALLVSAWHIVRRSRNEPEVQQPIHVVTITNSVGRETWPSLSPDGERVAFIANRDYLSSFGQSQPGQLYVKMIGAEEPLRISPEDGAAYSSPAWSPDGRSIVAGRCIGESAELVIFPALGGTERKLAKITQCPLGVSWSPDGKLIAFAGNPITHDQQSTISLLEIATGQARPFSQPPQAYLGDVGPRFAPDGKSVAFMRLISAGTGDLYVEPVKAGEAKRLTFDQGNVAGLAWIPDGSGIVFASGRGGRLNLWEVAIGGSQPRLLTQGAGSLAWPTISGNRLAFSELRIAENLWRMELSPTRVNHSQNRFIYTTRSELGPNFSPDSKKVVYQAESNLGPSEIWVCNADGSHPLQLTFLETHSGTPAWSPDGRLIAFDSRVHGHSDIFVIGAEGGPPRRITDDPADEVTPSWSSDGSWLYFASNRTGRREIWKIPAAGGTAIQLTKKGGVRPLESPDGKYLFYAKFDRAGIWRMLAGGGEETQVVDSLQVGNWGYWALNKSGIYYVDSSVKPRPAIKFVDLRTSRTSTIATVRNTTAWEPALAIAPDESVLLYVQLDNMEVDIVMLENFRW